MQVQDVLNKITERNSPIIGCIARSDQGLHHNLDDFDLDCDQIAEAVSDLLSVTDQLGDGKVGIDTVFTEYDGHCLIGQRLDGDLLVAVTDHLQRAGFKKLQVGLSLQTRMLGKALAEADNAAKAEAAPIVTPVTPKPTVEAPAAPQPVARRGGFFANLMGTAKETAPVANSDPANTEGKVRKVYRGQVYWE